MKVLIAGWFSFEQCNVTAGDLMARDVTCKWLEKANIPYEVASAPPFTDGLNWRNTDPKKFSHVIFVCGPFPYIEYSLEFLKHFDKCCLIGLDLSMIEPTDVWNPFDVLIERDSSANFRPDISFGFQKPKVPVVGIILVHPQHEYKEKSKHQIANEAVYRLINSQEMVAVPIDTGLDPNTTNLRTAIEVESLISRMDVVITTRLHGTVLALKNKVPVIAIDPISGGAKVSFQARTLGWDLFFSVDTLSDEGLRKAFNYCNTEEARKKAEMCRNFAVIELEKIRLEVLNSLTKAEYNVNDRVWFDEKIDKTLLAKPSYSLKEEFLYKIRAMKRKLFITIKTVLRE